MLRIDYVMWGFFRRFLVGILGGLWSTRGKKRNAPQMLSERRSKSFCGCLRICGVANVLLPAGGLRGCG